MRKEEEKEEAGKGKLQLLGARREAVVEARVAGERLRRVVCGEISFCISY